MSAVCPECRQGKHPNCDGMALDPDTDYLVACVCRHGGEARGLPPLDVCASGSHSPSKTPDCGCDS